MNKIKIFIICLIILDFVLNLFSTITVHASNGGLGLIAQGGASILWSDLINITAPKFQTAKIGDIITALLPFVFRIAGFVLLGLLILGGFEIMTAQGDPKKIASGNQRIFNAIVGFIIMVASFLIVRTLGFVFDIAQFKVTFF